MQTEETNIPEYNASPTPETIETFETLAQPTPDNPPWNSWTAFGVWAASVVFIAIIPSLLVGFYFQQAGVKFADPIEFQAFLDKDVVTNILKVVGVIPAHIFTLILAWMIVTKFNQFSFRQTLGWSFNGFKIWYLFVIVILILILIAVLVSFFGKQENELTKIVSSSRTAAYLVALMATLTAPIVEEVVYRGILYSAFQKSFGVLFAVVLVTFLFGIVHVPQNINDYAAISIIFLLSLILTLIRVKTKNLLPCIVLHTIFNGIQSLLLIIEPYLNEFANQPQNKTAAIISFLM